MLTYDMDNRNNLTMYEYLYNCIKEDIYSGKIREGEKLPSKREFAKQHKISIKTVENTYEQLLMEGYIYSREKSGYFVERIDNKYMLKEGTRLGGILKENEEKEYAIDFGANTASLEKFPYSVWSKLMREVMATRQKELLKTVPFNGVYELREEISKYLYHFRGIDVPADRIVIGAGTEYLYGRIIQLLGRQSIYAIEDPGYLKISKIYQSNNINWEYIRVDDEGLMVDELEKTKASIVHVSPAHHFPMGIIMPISRRQKLLAWAGEERERYIIEDDYDSEFRFTKRPIPAISSMDKNHRVIYLNNFSKTLAPSIRISYMVLPQKLMDRYKSTMNFYSCSVSSFEQYTMAEFMKRGYFERHIRRMKNFYRNKRDAVLDIIEQSEIKKIVEIEEKDAGNHFLMKLKTGLSDTQIKWAAGLAGIKLDCLSEYCMLDKAQFKGTIIVNYSDINEEEFKKAIKRLEALL